MRVPLVKTLYRILALLSLALLCTYCRPTDRTDQLQAAAGRPTDSLQVTSFDIEREDSPELANWAIFESGREVIGVPPAWTSHLEDNGQLLVLLPPNSADSTECVTFARLAKDSASLDYSAFARRLVTMAFPRFRAAGDTLHKLIFQRDFGIERYVSLRAKGKDYRGYCLAYVNDSCVYQFRIVLDRNRLKTYREEHRGELLNDIIGNLQIDRKYFMGNDNPLKQVVFLH
jgi:hypothetical protein